MRIKDILTGNFHRANRTPEKAGRTEKTGGNEPVDSGATGSIDKSDSTVISSEASELQQAAQLITESVEALKAMPDIREDAVAQAQSRVASGFYSSPEVLDRIAGIISEHLVAESPVSSSDLATDIIANISPQNADLTRQDLAAIRDNLEKGLYQDRDVIETVADKIYQFLGQLNSSEE